MMTRETREIRDRRSLRRRERVPSQLIPTLIAGALALSSACQQRIANAFAPPPPPNVTVAHPVIRPVTRYVEYSGTLGGLSVDIRARVPGYLEKQNYQGGALVKKGDSLFIIDKRGYQAAYDKAQAQVLADEAAAKAAEQDAQLAEELASRNAGSQIDRLLKTAKRDGTKAACAASRATLAAAKLDLEFCEVRAPCDGMVTKATVDIGNLVGAPGTPAVLATLLQTKPLGVTLDVSESDFLMFRNQRLATSPDAAPGQLTPGAWRLADLAPPGSDEFTVHGRVSYVDPGIDPETGTGRVGTRFENEDGSLLPGMFVRVRILLDSSEQLVVPETALASDQTGRFALVVDEEDKVGFRRVRVGALDGSMRVISEGLTTNDRVIVNGLQGVRPGMSVKPLGTELQEIRPARSTAPPPSAGAAPSTAEVAVESAAVPVESIPDDSASPK